MLLNTNQIKVGRNEIGFKTLNLVKLSELGFEIPPFLAIPTSDIPALIKSSELRREVSEKIKEKLPSSTYAVRSSALVEDGQNQSFAGQFHTEVQVMPENLPDAIQKVIQKADQMGFLNQFSILIQQYIEPDFSGVTFTRNPSPGREMVMEYHKGQGEALVSGKITPEKITFYHHETPPTHSPLSKDQIEVFKAIEAHFQFPQDIEWCLKDGQLYLLQTRPITTISQAQFKEIVRLETLLPPSQNYFFEKNEISEIAPRPKPLTMSLLERVYAKNGPVDQVYQRQSIHYSNTHFFKIIGNELYVDKNKELHSLLPAYSYSEAHLPPKIQLSRGFLRTVKNLWGLSTLKGDKIRLLENLKGALQRNDSSLTLKKVVDAFLVDYQIIFEINLLSVKVIGKLEQILKREIISVLEVLSLPKTLFLDPEIFESIHFSLKNLKGNSLDIDDDTDFLMTNLWINSSSTKKQWEALSDFKKNYLKKFIADAKFWQQMREMGRWLTVKLVNELRGVLFEMAKEKDFKDLKNIYFLTLQELKIGKFDEEMCKKRKKEYEIFSVFTFPQRLTGNFIESEVAENQGLSPGVAVGKLVRAEDVYKIRGRKILYTKTLPPELTQYFPEIEGIVSETGGLLSHLAIVARERGLPVVTNFHLRNGAEIGDLVEMDGEKGVVKNV